MANEQETYRRPHLGIEAASANIDDKTLHEYYLWPFMDGIHAGVASVMCSYNPVNNTYACENSKLLNGVLKGELAFQGFAMMDWFAQHSLQSANAGLDMLMPDGGFWGDNLTEAVRNGTVKEERVSDMATRILAAWYLVGQDKDFPPPGIGMKNLTQPHEPIDARDLRSKPILMQGARAGHVLVKNEKHALPLQTLRMVSVFGYDAAAPATKNTDRLFELGYMSSEEMGQAVLGGEYHFDQAAKGGTIITGGRAAANAPPYISDPLSAIQQRAQMDNTWVNWDLKSPNPDVNAASQACLVFINAMATEGWDRDGLHDDFSDALVLNVAAKCNNTIVVIHNAGIRLVDQWIEHPNVTAVVLAHLPGQDSGAALVSLLWGEANFSGKLPYTVARNESDYPVNAPCGRGPDNTTRPQCDYTEGVYLDYRAFDARNVTPRYEFGYGLSYTTFSYSDLVVELSASQQSLCNSASASSETGLWDVVATVQARVRNSGLVAGEEVAQLYVGIPGAPPKQLRGFEKSSLAPGQDATVRFELTRRDLSEWHVGLQKWVVQEGEYTVFVGASSRDIRLQGVISVKRE
ncbi:glycoside hydrolase 3 [Claviceps digitariae]|nr:glycoside hydrolase 3 [Claviceps digitariae]